MLENNCNFALQSRILWALNLQQCVDTDSTTYSRCGHVIREVHTISLVFEASITLQTVVPTVPKHYAPMFLSRQFPEQYSEFFAPGTPEVTHFVFSDPLVNNVCPSCYSAGMR
ncbi:uncharacterized protein C8R40DRAFT_1120693 [Lentinula edodes]|uniref:uncharacterized protein n=1 Tax=Lentinula edodes TaxID=5353 RepID=UPI001E8DFD8C|nr:uncharacterized protein C8R40DRAFT_1120693 [Lentinula edodes]KAH7871880.1 hypothetical protein C8R40DRAFT_1120693 [Lentinula edodes]